MLLPLLILAIGAAGAGYIPFGKYVSSDGQPLEAHFNIGFSVLPVALGLAGIGLAWLMYKKQSALPEKMSAAFGGLYKAAYRKFYIDEIYLFITKKILFNGVGRPAAWIDRNIVDGLVNFSGNATQFVSDKIKKWQSGKIQQYAVYFLMATVLIAAIFIYLMQ